MNDTELDQILATLDPVRVMRLDSRHDEGLEALLVELLESDPHVVADAPLRRFRSGSACDRAPMHHPSRRRRELADPRHPIGTGKRRFLMLAAAAVAVAGVGGIVLTRGGGGDDERSVVTVPPVDDLVAALAVSDPDAVQIPWYLPGVTPPGYDLVDLQAVVPSVAIFSGEPDGPSVNTQQWELADAGRTVVLVTAKGWPGDTRRFDAELAGPPPNADLSDVAMPEVSRDTVHNVEAIVTVGSVASVTWAEDGSAFALQGAGDLTTNDLVAIADASTTDAGVIDLSEAAAEGGVLAGYVQVSSHDSRDPIGDPFVRLLFESADAGNGRLSVEIAPAGAYSLDPADETIVVDGVEYRVTVWPAVGSVSERRTVSTVIGDRMILAAGSLPANQLVEVLANLRPATASEAALALREMSLRAAMLPVQGSAVFADGVAISVMAAPTGGFVLCVQQPIQCRWNVDAETIDGVAPQPLRYEIFTVNGERRAIGWYGGASEMEVDDDVPHEIVPASTGSGQFVSVPLADDQEMPMLSFPDDPDILAAGGHIAVGSSEVIRP